MGGQHSNLLAESYCDWWTLAGVEVLVDENPAGWLVAPVAEKTGTEAQTPTAPPSIVDIMAKTRADAPAAAAAKPVAPVELPADWDQFQQWLAKDDHVPGSQWDAKRVLPAGPVAAPVMLLTAWPELADQREGALFTGNTGRLLDAMLHATGLQRAACYVASLAITRPPGGRCSAEDMAELQRLLWHHIQIAKPGRLVLVGNDIVRIVAGVTRTEATGSLLFINHDGVNVEAVAVPHPATLLSRPAQKAAAWDSLKLLNQGR